MFDVTVNTRRAVVGTKELITTSSAGIQVQFTFSEDWDGLAKFAIFRNGEDGQEVAVALPNSNLTVIPAQSCSEDYVDEPVFVGVYGTDGLGAVAIPTIWTSLGVLRPGAVTTDIITPPQPTPDMWAQILNIANEAAAIADECEENEAERIANEQDRQGAEIARDMAEDIRQANEATRVSQETARQSAEAQRIQNEETRQAQEAYREEKYAEYVETVSEYAEAASGSATLAANYAREATTKATAAATSAAQANESALAANIRANRAAASATAAAESATTAQTQASAAASSAQAASTSAATASSAAALASASEANAADSATAAAGSAESAETSAQDASDSATAADQAKTAALAAQGAAEDAQDAAETAAASVSASAAQIAQNTSDISDLTSNLSDVEDVITDLTTGLDTKAPVILETASGAIASFDDGADGMPIKKLVAQIEPVQDLHGYDSPWPAGGGVNKVNAPDVTLSSGGYLYNGAFVIPAGTYTINFTPSNGASTSATVAILDSDGNALTSGSHNIPWTFTLASDAASMKIYVSGAGTYSNIQINEGSSALPFAPYSNICPISGHTGAEISGTGKNLLDFTVFQTYGNWSENTANYGNYSTSSTNRGYSLDVISGITYTLSFGITSGVFPEFLYLCRANGDDVSERLYTFTTSTYNNNKYTFTAEEGWLYYVRMGNTGNLAVFTAQQEKISYSQLELGSTATDYVQYTGNTISVNWETEAGTVYGGTITLNPDRTGTLVVDRAIVDLGTLNWSAYDATRFILFYAQILGMHQDNWANGICSVYPVLNGHDYNWGTLNDKQCILYYGGNQTRIGVRDSRYATAADLKAAMNGQTCVYPLASPQAFQLTAEQVSGILTSLYGHNNVWANTGDVTVEYPADTRFFIEKLTQPTEDDMTADHAISAGTFFMIGNSLYLATSQIAAGGTITTGTNATKLSLADALNTLNS